MQLRRLDSTTPSKMDLFPHINFLTFVLLLGLSSNNVFPTSTILKVEGSLLQLRKSQRDAADKLDSDHMKTPIQLRDGNSLENPSSNEDLGFTTAHSFHSAQEKHGEGVDPNHALQSVRETGVMGVPSMGDSKHNFSFPDEGESPFPTAFYREESNNDSEEIFLSARNETDHFGWAKFGWADVAMVTLFCSIIAGTVAGNMLVIAAVVTTRRLRTVTNCFVMSLAVADWLVGMFVMPPKVFLYFVDNEWRFGRIFCELWISLDILLCTASILSLCAISIDRYLAITRPLAYSRRRRSKRLALSMISCVWIAAVVITSPPIFGWYEENRNTDNKCDYNENTGYVVYSALGSFFLPLLVMLYVYARIACVIMRRQRSIQKLQRGDRKSQYCGSDAEEPLHQKDRDEDAGNGEGAEKPSHRIGNEDGKNVGENPELTPTLTTDHIPHHHHGLSESRSADSQPRPGNQGSSLLGRFRLSSCTASDKEEDVKCNRKKSAELANRQNKYSDRISGNGANPEAAEALAISLPDPATLASGSGTENSSSSNTDQESACGCSHHSNPNSLTSQQEQLRPGSSGRYSNQIIHRQQHHQFVSRMKTGSRLCHHSIATASPQKNIHRIHQASTSTGREFGAGDHEIHLKSTESCRSLDKSPRVWTVETTTPSPGSGKRKGKESKRGSPNCRNCSYEHELAESCTMAGEKSANQESVMMMECSPAGNPASLMSAASAPGNSTNPLNPSPHDKRSPYSNRIQSRIYQPHNTQAIHHRIIPNNQFTPSESIRVHRARSMKFVPVIHTNDQNHNGGTSSRDFSSGRIASFKRETKTAQTLAAVVGGFIICWLPFFVAYIMGPFTPSSDTISSALMDALIWLGWSNSAINPFIYAFYSDQFRSAFWRLTVHKCEAILRNRNQSRNSPRRYEDPPQAQRVST